MSIVKPVSLHFLSLSTTVGSMPFLRRKAARVNPDMPAPTIRTLIIIIWHLAYFNLFVKPKTIFTYETFIRPFNHDSLVCDKHDIDIVPLQKQHYFDSSPSILQ